MNNQYTAQPPPSNGMPMAQPGQVPVPYGQPPTNANYGYPISQFQATPTSSSTTTTQQQTSSTTTRRTQTQTVAGQQYAPSYQQMPLAQPVQHQQPLTNQFPAKQGIQQNETNVTQTIQAAPQAASTPVNDFTHLMQAAPVPQQQVLDFAQLIQAAPAPQQSTLDFTQLTQLMPPAVTIPAEATGTAVVANVGGKPTKAAKKKGKMTEKGKTAEKKVESTDKKVESAGKKGKATEKKAKQAVTQPTQAEPSTATSSKTVKTTTTTTRTARYVGEDAGEKARRTAEKKGEKALNTFEKKVQRLLGELPVCPARYPWYCISYGYLCADGTHLIYHADIDMAIKRPDWVPKVAFVNTFGDPEAEIGGVLMGCHPPQVDSDMPMHRAHREFCQMATLMGFEGNSGPESEGGCPPACSRGRKTIPREEVFARARQDGFDPDATRHGIFGKPLRES